MNQRRKQVEILKKEIKATRNKLLQIIRNER